MFLLDAARSFFPPQAQEAAVDTPQDSATSTTTHEAEETTRKIDSSIIKRFIDQVTDWANDSNRDALIATWKDNLTNREFVKFLVEKDFQYDQQVELRFHLLFSHIIASESLSEAEREIIIANLFQALSEKEIADIGKAELSSSWTPFVYRDLLGQLFREAVDKENIPMQDHIASLHLRLCPYSEEMCLPIPVELAFGVEEVDVDSHWHKAAIAACDRIGACTKFAAKT